jgi:leucyl/phenylalanyl-tRNA--protein transferase
MPYTFPSAENANEDGIVAIGGDLHPDTLVDAYSKGIFPWPIDPNYPMTWFSPDPRGVLPVADIHISKSTQRILKKQNFRVEFNTRFEEIIQHCAKVPRKDQTSTWIDNQIIQGYHELYKRELAYSVAVFKEDKLVGGLYGVCLGGFISGESMFHLEDGASKSAIITLSKRLSESGIKYLDTQMVTPVLKSFGAINISRFMFLDYLNQCDFKTPRKKIFLN